MIDKQLIQGEGFNSTDLARQPFGNFWRLEQLRVINYGHCTFWTFCHFALLIETYESTSVQKKRDHKRITCLVLLKCELTRTDPGHAVSS